MSAVTGRVSDCCHLVLCRVMDRVATGQMRHAAFLLGYDFASGYGSGRGLLAHVGTFQDGETLAHLEHDRGATAADIARARELSELERLQWARGAR